MEWYKHSTGSHEDPDINEIWDEFGDSGYVMFFVILEIYGREFNSRDDDDFLWLNINYIARKCRKSSAKVKKFLRFGEEISRFSLKISNQSDKKIGLKIPKFIEISSNWTKRPKVQPTEVPTETPTAKEVEVEVEDIYPQDIISFVNEFIDYICNTHKNLSPDKTDSLIKNSCDSIDKLIRLDSFNLDYIRLVLGWAVKDNFWGNNILSLAGLRTKSKNGLKKFQNIAVAYENKDGEKEKPKEKVYITGELGLAN